MKSEDKIEWVFRGGILVAVGLSACSLFLARGIQSRQQELAARVQDLAAVGDKQAALAKRMARVEFLTKDRPAADSSQAATASLEPVPSGDGTDGASNLDKISKMDPKFLQSLQEKYKHGQDVKAYVDSHMQKRLERQKADVAKYGPGIQDLSRRASAGGEDGEKAYNELLSKYPESNAAISAIAEKAMAAALEMKTGDVQQYFSQLQAKSGSGDVITEQGFQATPALQNYLARSYISEGKYQEAEQIISALSSNYSSELVPERGEGSEPEWITGSALASQLKEAITNASTGAAAGGVPTGGPPGQRH